jgi:hypothetical protein
MPATASALKEKRNRVTRRFVQRQDDGSWMLFTFTRVSDEIYPKYHHDSFTQAQALAWVDSVNDDALAAPRRPASPSTAEIHITASDLAQLRLHAETHPHAALSRVLDQLTVAES